MVRSKVALVADAGKLADRVDQVLDLGTDITKLLDAYFDPTGKFAGEMFDSLGINESNEFHADDLVAASLLDVRFGPRAVRRILVDKEFDAGLHAVKNSWKFEEMASSDPIYYATVDFYRAIRRLPGVGDTKTSKLLARKRPDLVPIGDSVILSVLGIRGDQAWWRPLATVVGSGGRMATLLSLRPIGVDVSKLRLLDVALWMLGSNSRIAKAVRKQVLGDGAPWPTNRDTR